MTGVDVKALRILLVAATPVAAQVPPSSPDTARAPAVGRGARSVGAQLLSDTIRLNPNLRLAAATIADDLRRTGDNPSEFYITVEPSDSGGVAVFHLWHEAAFYPENAHVRGNPGGRSRDIWYDLRKHGIPKRLFWQ